VIASLKKIDAFACYLVNETVLLCDAPGPTTGQHVSERFGLAESIERVA
jgi:hypothetical protein